MTCEECEDLRHRVRELEAELRGETYTMPIVLNLTSMEACILRAMMATSRPRSRDFLVEVTRGVPGQKKDDPISNVIETKICHLRAKLRPHGVVIENVWGLGWKLTADSRERLLHWQDRRAA